VDGRAARCRVARRVGRAVLAVGLGHRLDGRRPPDVRHGDGAVDELCAARRPGAQVGRRQRQVGRVRAPEPPGHGAGQGAEHVAARPGTRVLERVLSQGVGRRPAVLPQPHRRILGNGRFRHGCSWAGHIGGARPGGPVAVVVIGRGLVVADGVSARATRMPT